MTEHNQAFTDFFRVAFSDKEPREPFDYQRRLAMEDLLPSLVNVPTGAGKTTVGLVIRFGCSQHCSLTGSRQWTTACERIPHV